MARHHSYSKRSRESRKAMNVGPGDQRDYPDGADSVDEDWQTSTDEPDGPPAGGD